MKLLLFVVLGLLCSVGYSAYSGSTYLDIERCQKVCGDKVCQRGKTSHERNMCKDDANIFKTCFNGGDIKVYDDCEDWREHLDQVFLFFFKKFFNVLDFY